MKLAIPLLLFIVAHCAFGEAQILYENNFEKEELGTVPADFLVLDGNFKVREDAGNKFLELPGAPLDSFAVQFGPVETSDVIVSARIRGTAQGRRFPAFGVGLNGVAGYRLQVSPAKKMLELYKDQEVQKAMPWDWKPGVWTQLQLCLQKAESGWRIKGKVWTEGSAEPGGWLLETAVKEEPPAGRASVFGSPFSGTPIQFDDLTVRR